MAINLRPELGQGIIQYLGFDTLKAFSLVCKAWYLSSHPVLWKHFSCKAPTTSEEYTIWLDTIRRNASSFKHIYDIGYGERAPEIGNLLLDRCHSLVTVEAVVTRMDAQNPCHHWEETLRPLIERNRASLQRLQFQVIDGPFMTTLQLPSLLASLPHLRSLDLDVSWMSVEELLPVLDACPSSLEHLSLRPSLHRKSSSQENINTTVTPLRLKRLHIQGAFRDRTLDDVLSCLAVHSLEELRISSIYPLQIPSKLREAFWQLTHLCLKTVRPSPIRYMPQILDAIQPNHLRQVDLNNLDTESATKLIERQHRSLEFMNVDFLKGHAGSLAEILATCHKLKVLVFTTVPFVDIQTLIGPWHPWVCAELEVFEGSFGLSRDFYTLHPSDPNGLNDAERSRQVEDQFMQRLGRLTKLRRLVQRGDSLNDMDIMAWSLSSGLVHLEGLASLKTFMHANRGFPSGIGIPEMVFMKQHWHRLKELTCYKVGDLEEWLATEWPELKVT